MAATQCLVESSKVPHDLPRSEEIRGQRAVLKDKGELGLYRKVNDSFSRCEFRSLASKAGSVRGNRGWDDGGEIPSHMYANSIVKDRLMGAVNPPSVALRRRNAAAPTVSQPSERTHEGTQRGKHLHQTG